MYGCHATQVDTTNGYYNKISFFDWKPSGSNLNDYLKDQYKEWLINKIVINLYNFDGGVNEYMDKPDSFDTDKRMPSNWGSGTNNYFWRKHRFHDTRYHFRVCKPLNLEDFIDCKLDNNWLVIL